MAFHAQRLARRSRFRAALVALLVHTFLFTLFALVVLVPKMRPASPDIVVQTAPQAVEEQVMKREFATPFRADKPAAPSSPATNVVTAPAISQIPIPQTQLDVESPDLGTGWGDGFGRGTLGTGSGKGAHFFGTPAAGDSVILVIDVSTSMPAECGESGLRAIKNEVRRVVESFQPSTRFNLICFGNDADGFAARPVAASPENKTRAHAFMEDYFSGSFRRTRTEEFGRRGEHRDIRYTPIESQDVPFLRGTSGGSRYDLALVAAFMQRPETVFLITDGEPSTQKGGKRLSKSEIIDLVVQGAREYSSSRPPQVNCIGINGIGAGYLQDIAKAFRGHYRNIVPRNL
ncbi:MAG TPA: hypothetical protein VMN36_09835 [Verrucomicrobiales bacterium]|nr:hypothetical protein [Verrucomicrobiales bacterium]